MLQTAVSFTVLHNIIIHDHDLAWHDNYINNMGMQHEQSVTRPSVTLPYTDVHRKYPDPWKVGVIKRMREQCIPGSFFFPLPLRAWVRGYICAYPTHAPLLSDCRAGVSMVTRAL